MDPDMIRPRRGKPCPPTPTPRPHGENVVEACQHDSYNFREDPLPQSLWPCHQPPRPPSHVRNYYWNDNLDWFSRMQRGDQSLDMGYRMNFRDPLNDFHEDHALRHCMALHPPSAGHHHHGPPPMQMGHHRRHEPPPLLGHHGEPQHSYENPNGCTIM
ncbi:hypothetical protein H5410_010642 [Solanum commersonii]|uniref:Uncharacterized protein n=1 Tax=Solanum commersonii TaxID=4109 RepID=A0A9J6ALA0_SOLCO|nr:hypothetical protein H5410_010642 [Solanum commersonii]